MLFQMGLDAMLIWVLQDNPACGFYEKLGEKNYAQENLQSISSNSLRLPTAGQISPPFKCKD
jgi:hypothetical protein